MNFFTHLFGKKEAPISASAPASKAYIDQSPLNLSEWKNCEIHLMLLCEFLKPTYANKIEPEKWREALSEEPRLTIDKFIKQGLLPPLSLKDTVNHCSTAAELKKMLKERYLKVSGKKLELIERLIEADKASILEIYKGENIFECSAEIRPRVLQYLADKEGELNAAVAEAMRALHAKDFLEACRIIRLYEERQVRLPVKSLQIATVYLDGRATDNTPKVSYEKPSPIRDPRDDVPEIKEIFTACPKILNDLSKSDIETIQIVVSISHLLHGKLSLEWMPDQFSGSPRFNLETTIRVFQSHIRYIRDLNKWREIGIKQAEVLGSAQCDECAKITNIIYSLDKLPELPYEKCTQGCFCFISPEISFND